ncbi:DUF6090 family protein [Marivirga salinae]|uniref:DUF6090 family protein n=1 Tax=Marivirga salinarum TaxID=3059078 RepID=A0AA51N9J2_9BACT|nr:DUF6090 family protein [Marivirga sp. BDSF4-3]WMN11063.1 DUF6090 family protein [Marivirga sp. BDSF4-3]
MNKNAKNYILYVVGEILLVVIGILITLQTNNWNSGKQQRNLEIMYLTEIKLNWKLV